MKSILFAALLSALSLHPAASRAADRRYPDSPFVVNVTRPPYHAKGDGRTDDTDALQAAINANTGRHRVLYFPRGTYLISRTLTWPKKWEGRDNWGKTFLCGESRDETILRLKDSAFTDAKKPQAMMWCGGFGSADWFHNYVENLTFDTGAGNPGAVALQFYSNNSGAVRDCRFLAAEGSGYTGLDLAHRDMNGPLLVRNCEVLGFDTGITCARSVNGQTFEHITLRGQRRTGFKNEGQSVSIRGLTYEGSAPAVMTYGTLALLDSKLTGSGAAAQGPAVVNFNHGRIFVRDLITTGYRRALADLETPDSAKAWRLSAEDQPRGVGPDIREYFTGTATTAFPSPPDSLRLAVKETPEVAWDAPDTWADVDRFGADPTGREDSSAAIQKAMDSGATTVFLPGTYRLASPVTVRGKVRRITGVGGMISYGKKAGSGPDFRVVDGEAAAVHFEHFAYVHGGVEIATRRTVVFRSVSDCDLTMTAAAEGGEIFAEDFVTHGLALRRQKMWARQLNVENEGTHIRNEAGDLWVLGYKTERGGTLLETTGGGRSEVLGGFSYTTTAGKLAPMFVNDNSRMWSFFSEVCFNGDPFAVIIKESRGGETKTLTKDQARTVPYAGYPLPQ